VNHISKTLVMELIKKGMGSFR